MLDLPVQPAMTNNIAQQSIPVKTPAVAPVNDTGASDEAASRGSNGGAQQQPTELQRYFANIRSSERLIGPPPSFQTNVLDATSDIILAIKRQEAKREDLRNSDAVAPVPKPAEFQAAEESKEFARTERRDNAARDDADAREAETDRLA